MDINTAITGIKVAINRYTDWSKIELGATQRHDVGRKLDVVEELVKLAEKELSDSPSPTIKPIISGCWKSLSAMSQLKCYAAYELGRSQRTYIDEVIFEVNTPLLSLLQAVEDAYGDGQ